MSTTGSAASRAEDVSMPSALSGNGGRGFSNSMGFWKIRSAQEPSPKSSEVFLGDSCFQEIGPSVQILEDLKDTAS